MNKTLARVVTILLGMMFVYSGIVKFWDAQTFAEQVQAYNILSWPWVPMLAITLPMFELLTGLWLLVGWRTRIPLLAVIGMITIFTIALISVAIRGLAIDCGCFGSGGSNETWFVIGRDLIILALSVLLIVSNIQRKMSPV